MRPDLFSPVALGTLTLRNRLVMAPMTRGRSGDRGVPGDLLVEYYRQRASVGLIVTEGTYPSDVAKAYVGQPGIVTVEQRDGWGRVAEAVHAEDGRVFMQLMHGGRVAHPSLNGGLTPVAPSSLVVGGTAHTPSGREPYAVPRALEGEEIAGVVQEHARAARAAVDAGFDGVEIHAANGYLLHQFLSSSSNRRADEYGADRARLVVDVVGAVVGAVGGGRVGLRVSPGHAIHDVVEDSSDDLSHTYVGLARSVAPLGLAYLSVLHPEPEGDLVQSIRRELGGPLVVNSGFSRVTSREEAHEYVERGVADAVAVGRPLIANPDLLHRWRQGLALNEFDPRSSYGTTSAGYTDYPAAVRAGR